MREARFEIKETGLGKSATPYPFVGFQAVRMAAAPEKHTLNSADLTGVGR